MRFLLYSVNLCSVLILKLNLFGSVWKGALYVLPFTQDCPNYKFWLCCMYEFNTPAQVRTCRFFLQVILCLLSLCQKPQRLSACASVTLLQFFWLFLEPLPSRDVHIQKFQHSSLRFDQIVAVVWAQQVYTGSNLLLAQRQENKSLLTLFLTSVALCARVSVIFWFSSPRSSPVLSGAAVLYALCFFLLQNMR